MSDQLNRLSLPFERIEAIYGTRLPEWLKPYFMNSHGEVASELKVGEIGCYASHLLVMKRIAEGNSPALVLEDDLDISPDLPAILDASDKLPKGWDIIRLSNPYKRRFFPVCPIVGQYQAVKFSRVPASAAAYLITPKAANHFLTYRGLRTLPVDQDLRRTWECGLTTYGVFPRPVIPDIGPSSIMQMGGRAISERRRPRGGGPKDAILRIVHDVRWLGIWNWGMGLLTR